MGCNFSENQWRNGKEGRTKTPGSDPRVPPSMPIQYLPNPQLLEGLESRISPLEGLLLSQLIYHAKLEPRCLLQRVAPSVHARSDCLRVGLPKRLERISVEEEVPFLPAKEFKAAHPAESLPHGRDAAAGPDEGEVSQGRAKKKEVVNEKVEVLIVATGVEFDEDGL